MTVLVRRLAQLVAVVLAVTFLAFTAMNTLGDPLFNVVGFYASVDCDAVLAGEIEDVSGQGGTGVGDCQVVTEAREEFHLDEPLPIRYGRWVGDLLHGDFGTSFKNRMPVNKLLADRLPKSLLLMAMAEIFAVAVSIPWAVAAAYRANRTMDRASTVGAFGMLALPNFALGVILFYFFVVRWQIFPSRFEDDNLLIRLKSLVLPALTLGMPLAATYFRLLRTDLITTLQEDFVVMAKAKGLSNRWIMFRHVLRPSLFSVVTVFGLNTAALMGGALIVEQIFSIPGLGRALVEASIRDDYPVVLGAVVVIATGFVVINFAVDLVYSYLDPRVRRES
ncbi:MAG: ABC transporter permease [Acidimicrobiales bacterium]|nr:peptide ABC transporter [Acidimicrobiaceae bacterium]MDP6077291.1 ABC transporter permease [Acidimicrobiales bacterium]MDP7258344.1 ABC transporter permease [Acidimicrobiales bacterium]HJO79940.1 ABC transporter permease [Acidimicrobiales bacterium]